MRRFTPNTQSLLISGLLAATAQVQAADQLDAVLVESSGIDLPGAQVSQGDAVKASPAADAGDALRAIPGVSGVRMGGHGIDPVIRGQSQTRLNVLIDGAYIHGGCPNRMDPPTAYAPIETFDEVTVIKGSHSVVHGGGGSGGTVLLNRNTQPLSAGESLRGKVGAGYRDNSETSDGFADLTVGNEKAFLRGVLVAKDARNYEDGNGAEVLSAYSEQNRSLILGVLPDADTRLEFSIDQTRSDDVMFAGASMDGIFADDDSYRLRFHRTAETGPFSAIRAEVYVSNVDHLMDNYSLRNLAAADKSAPSSSDTVGGRLVAELEAGGSQWTVGVDRQNNDREADRYNITTGGQKEAIMWPGASIDQTGLFAEMIRPVGDMDAISAGLRYDRVIADASRAGEDPAVAAWFSPNESYARYYGNRASKQTENNVGGFLRYEMGLTDLPGMAYLGVSRTVRTADATERFMAQGAPNSLANLAWVGNPDIDPEKHHQIEAGMELDWGDVQMTAAVYYNKVDDYILRDRAHGQAGILRNDNATIYRNVDARFYGTELGLDYRLNDNWSLGGSLAYVHATNTTDSRAIAQTPPLEGTVNLGYRKNDWNLGASLRLVDKQTRVDDDVNTGSGLDVGQTSGFGVLDLHGSVDLDQGVSVNFGVDNVLDKLYAEHLNKPNAFDTTQVQVNEPGRSVWAKLSVSF